MEKLLRRINSLKEWFKGPGLQLLPNFFIVIIANRGNVEVKDIKIEKETDSK